MDVVCESCGELNRSAGEFCISCGAFLAWEEEASATGSAQSPGPAAARPRPEPDPSVHDRRAASPSGLDQEVRQPAIHDQPAVAGRSAARPQPILAPAQPAPSGPICSSCGRQNESGRRFCARCGQEIGPTRTAARRPGRDSAADRRRERAGLRSFRDSLPALYRWRRVGLVILVIGLITALVLVAGRDPLGWARARWYDLRGTLIAAPGVQASAVPPADGSPQAGGNGKDGEGGKDKKDKKGKQKNDAVQFSDPAALVDGSVAEWTTDWTVRSPATTCGGAPGTPTIELTLAQPTRIRAIDIRAGLGADRSERPLQFRPQQVGVSVGGGACRAFPLADTPDPQRLDFDTDRPVSVIRIGIDAAFTAREDGQDRLSITEITLLARPH